MTEPPHLLSASGVAVLRQVAAQRPVLALDFDGTLAAIAAALTKRVC